MLKRIDRLQVAVPDRSVAAESWTRILGAEPAGEDRIACLGAARTRLRLGDGFIDLLEPDGAGSLSDAVAKRGEWVGTRSPVPLTRLRGQKLGVLGLGRIGRAVADKGAGFGPGDSGL